MADSLSPKHKAFCLEYIKDLNGTQAAIRAGYSKNCARGTASTLLTYPNIKAKISELMKDREKKTKITAQKVVQEIAKKGFLKKEDMKEGEGLEVLISFINSLKKETLKRDLKDIETEKLLDTLIKATVELEGIQAKALEMLAKHTGAFNKDESDKTVIKVKVGD